MLDEMRPGFKLAIALAAVVAVWLVVVFLLGVRFVIVRPVEGILPYTFNGWAEHPAARHLFLAQYQGEDFAVGRVYDSHPYPILFFFYLFLAPFHFILGLPYEVAHNFLSYLYVVCLSGILIVTSKRQLTAVLEAGNPFRWLLALMAIGIVVTCPQPWISTLAYDRDNLFILTAGAFCYLSAGAFNDGVPRKALLGVGLFVAVWLPIFTPAWILAGVFFNRALIVERRWLLSVLGVSALAALNLIVPKVIAVWFALKPIGSGFRYRSGLDGSTQYMTTVYQAIVAPVGPRHWPVASYFVIALVFAVVFHYQFRKHQKQYYPLRQACFLLIPYSMIAILFPQLTSIHPYSTDPLIVVPACFLIAFWSLREEFWRRLTGPTYVAWLVVASLILMTNLLTVAQNLRP